MAAKKPSYAQELLDQYGRQIELGLLLRDSRRDIWNANFGMLHLDYLCTNHVSDESGERAKEIESKLDGIDTDFKKLEELVAAAQKDTRKQILELFEEGRQ